MSSVTILVNNKRIKAGLNDIRQRMNDIVDLAIDVQQIPAPTFEECERAAFVEQKFKQFGLENVHQDELCNVYGFMPGTLGDESIVLTAHSDTVFPASTDLSVRIEKNLIFGPGISDNSLGVAGLLSLIRTLQEQQLQPQRNIWFVVNVGEEGLGDLAGMRVVTKRFADASAFIVIEGGMYGYLLHEAIGVRRYRVEVKTEGGHSWSDFGRLNAIHVLGYMVSLIDRIRVPDRPKTTFNIGVIEGGTSINTIASSASFLLDLRSEDPNGLAYLVDQFDKVVTRTQDRYDAKIEVHQIGNRPAGEISRRSLLVQQADAALRAVGCEKIHYLRGSTDANIPLSLGLPAVCVGLARSANAHRVDEYFDTTHLVDGMQQLLLLTMAAANYV